MSFVVVAGDHYEIIEDMRFSVHSFYNLRFTKLNLGDKS